MTSPTQKNRTSVYVDGFNLYFGMRSKGWARYYWIDIVKFAEALMLENDELVGVKYFTSRISGPSDKQARQSTYLDALDTLASCKIYYGKFQSNQQICKRCGAMTFVPQEKMTDVNIAVELLGDAYENGFDKALLVSADSDLTAPIISVRRLFPDKQVVVAFPPGRASKQLNSVASGSFQIGRRTLARCQFPDRVVSKSGYPLDRPKSWA